VPSLYLPTACEKCDRTWLAPPACEEPTTCRFCNGPAHIVPGECYRADDVPFFERIESAVHGAHVSEHVSNRLWATLSNVSERWRRPDVLLLPVMDAVPALRFLLNTFPQDRTQLARAVGMVLATITTHLRTLEARQSSSSSAPATPTH
jgi:hypothetical protein